MVEEKRVLEKNDEIFQFHFSLFPAISFVKWEWRETTRKESVKRQKTSTRLASQHEVPHTFVRLHSACTHFALTTLFCNDSCAYLVTTMHASVLFAETRLQRILISL